MTKNSYKTGPDELVIMEGILLWEDMAVGETLMLCFHELNQGF